METIVLIMMILVCFNFMLKQTCHTPWSIMTLAVVCALFVGLTWPYAIEQSKTQIADWLANASLMQDTAVILSIEVIIQLSFCMLAVHIQNTGHIRRRVLYTYKALRWFPGVLIFPVLFSALVALIFAFPGVSFSLLAWGMAAAVLVAVPAGTNLLKSPQHEKYLLLEVLFLTTALIGILGIIATVNGQTAVEGIGDVDWGALVALVGLVALGTVAGMIVYRIKLKKLKD